MKEDNDTMNSMTISISTQAPSQDPSGLAHAPKANPPPSGSLLMPVTRPSLFTPTDPRQMIGSGGKIGQVLLRKARAMRGSRSGPLNVLFWGPPGVGKTTIAKLITDPLITHECYREIIAGGDVTAEVVRRWSEQLHYAPPADGFQVKLIDEVDKCSPAAQGLLLGFFDALNHGRGGGRACVATTNVEPGESPFWTRWQKMQVLPPTEAELAQFVQEIAPATDLAAAGRIAAGAKGNVRQALLDTESWLDLNGN
jgi:hypothetical protein